MERFPALLLVSGMRRIRRSANWSGRVTIWRAIWSWPDNRGRRKPRCRRWRLNEPTGGRHCQAGAAAGGRSAHPGHLGIAASMRAATSCDRAVGKSLRPGVVARQDIRTPIWLPRSCGSDVQNRRSMTRDRLTSDPPRRVPACWLRPAPAAGRAAKAVDHPAAAGRAGAAQPDLPEPARLGAFSPVAGSRKRGTMLERAIEIDPAFLPAQLGLVTPGHPGPQVRSGARAPGCRPGERATVGPRWRASMPSPARDSHPASRSARPVGRCHRAAPVPVDLCLRRNEGNPGAGSGRGARRAASGQSGVARRLGTTQPRARRGCSRR